MSYGQTGSARRPGSHCHFWACLWSWLSVHKLRKQRGRQNHRGQLKDSFCTVITGRLWWGLWAGWHYFGSGRTLIMLVNRWNHSKAQWWPFFLLSGLTFRRQKFKLTFQAKIAIRQQRKKKGGLAQSLKAFASVPESCIHDRGQVIFCFKIHGF